MIETNKIKVGDKVHYILPVKGYGFENGIVKDVTDDEYVRVVYHCDGKWEEYYNYTGAMTAVRNLHYGWK